MSSTHGGNLLDFLETYRCQPLDFSANINPYGVPDGVRQALWRAVDEVTAYPDPQSRRLRAALAKEHRLSAEWISCGNGAADLIYRFFFAMRPKRVLLLAPTFSEYEQAARAVHAEVSLFFLSAAEDYRLSERLLGAITEEVELFVLCNPNNPTGQPVPLSLLQAILRRCEQTGTFLLADECFQEFLPPDLQASFLPTMASHPRCAVLKAFTKLYAIPGVRLGYLCCADEALHQAIADNGQAWSVSVLAEQAGLAALAETEYVCRTVKEIQAERRRMTVALTALGLRPLGEANFLFFRYEQLPLKERLAAQGMLIRRCDNYHGLDGADYRIAIRTPAENDRLLAALSAVLEDNSWLNPS